MAESYSPRMGVRRWTDNGDTFTRDELDQSFLNIETRAAIFGNGTLAARPAPGVIGRFYLLDTTEPNAALRGQLYFDTGVSWVQGHEDITALLAAKANVAHSHALAELPVAAAGEVSATKLVRSDDYRLQRERYPGEIAMTGALVAPTGWLLCDGASYTTAEYPDLFAAIGYRYGGAGANFNVPNSADRFPVGKSGTKAVGSVGGSASRVMTAALLPQHTHNIAHTHTINHGHGASSGASGGHGHSASSGVAGAHDHTASAAAAGSHTHTASSGASSVPHTHTIDHNHGLFSSGDDAPDHVHPQTYDNSYAPLTGGTVGHAAANTTGANPATGGFNTGGASVRHQHDIDVPAFFGSSGAATSTSHSHSVSVSTDGSHAHAITVDSVASHSHTVTVVAAADHTHTVTVNDFAGNSGASSAANTANSGVLDPVLDIQNPFFAVNYMIKF